MPVDTGADENQLVTRIAIYHKTNALQLYI